MRILILALTGGLLAAAAPQAPAAPPSPAISAAVADPARPAEDVARDAARKPAEMLAFAGVEPGDKAVDLVMGGGYFTRILAKTVGPTGKVYAYQPDEFVAFQATYGENQKKVAAAYPNVTAIGGSLGAVSIPDKVDVVLTSQNYHDFHLKPFPADTAAKVNKAVFDALKPGGVYLVIDHYAAPGSGLEAPEKLHRIDPAIVKSEVTAAGFAFDGQLDVLRNPADPHTSSVFDKSIKGRTDQFVYRFRKPAS
jgi:predicted methyltransferase